MKQKKRADSLIQLTGSIHSVQALIIFRSPLVLIVAHTTQHVTSAIPLTMASAPHQLTNEQLQEEFRAGVTATLRSWSAFRTAVESGWGGPQSLEKAEYLRQSICDILNGKHYPPKMDVTEMEDNLAIFLEEEFSVTLEDGSERQVAETVFRMYEDCFGRGNPSYCRQIVEIATQAAELVAKYPVQIQLDEHDDDDDMEDVQAVAAVPTGSIAQSYGSEFLFGNPRPVIQSTAPAEPPRQLGESAPVKEELPVDEDGFAPITTKKKKKQPTPMS